VPYFHVITATRRRIIDDLREVFGRHPVYQKVEIQDKYAFDERPQYAIIVQNASVGRVQLAADNFLGNLTSFVKLARVADSPGQFLEWVREDTLAIIKNNDVFPTPPGFYFVELIDKSNFVIDPLFSVEQEVLIEKALGGETAFTLQNFPILVGTFELFIEGMFTRLCEGVDYLINTETGELVLINPLVAGDKLVAAYNYPGALIGPIPFLENHSNNTALPGVIMAFGRRIEAGDRQVVIVSEEREKTARVFGGRWDITFTLDCVARDPEQRDEIADECLIALWVEKKPFLEQAGILLSDIGMSGETEDIYDETTEEYYYKSTVDFTMQTDWELAVPLITEVRLINLIAGIETTGGISGVHPNDFCLLSDEEMTDLESSIVALGPRCPIGIKDFYLFGFSSASRSRINEKLLRFPRVLPDSRPFIPGKSSSFERLG